MNTKTIPTSINAVGISEIAAFLAKNHKFGGNHFTPGMLRAWAEEAEFQLAEGNPPTIEIPARLSATGAPITFTVSAAGVDSSEVEIDE